jgi:hypothetical protein
VAAAADNSSVKAAQEPVGQAVRVGLGAAVQEECSEGAED